MRFLASHLIGYAALAVLLGFAATYAVASLWLPFGWDHGIMASVGDAIVRGGLPFSDGWDMKGPVAYLFFAASEVAFGHVMWGIRVVELIVLAPTVYLIHRIVAARTTPFLGAGTGLAFYLWIASSGWFYTAQPEIWVTAMSVIAIFPFLRPGAAPSTAVIFLCGLLIGCAGLVKPFYLGFGLVPVAALLTASGFSIRSAVLPALWLAAGAIAAVIFVVAYFAANGALMEAINVHLRFTSLIYSRTLDWRGFFFALLDFVGQPTIAISVPFVAIGLWSLREDRLLLPLATWLGLTFAFVILQTKAFTYHWFPLYAPYLILAAFGVHTLFNLVPRLGPAKIATVIACAIFFAQVAAVPTRELVRLAGYLAGLYTVETHYDRYRFRQYTVGDQIRAAKHIEAHSDPTDSVFVWGVDTTASFLSRRANATRFTFNAPLTLDSPFKELYRVEMMQALMRNPPKYIVVGLPWEMDETKQSFSDFAEFKAFVTQNYVLETRFGILDLYRRKGASAK